MPNFDGRGPDGRGPTGKRRGRCAAQDGRGNFARNASENYQDNVEEPTINVVLRFLEQLLGTGKGRGGPPGGR